MTCRLLSKKKKNFRNGRNVQIAICAHLLSAASDERQRRRRRIGKYFKVSVHIYLHNICFERVPRSQQHAMSVYLSICLASNYNSFAFHTTPTQKIIWCSFFLILYCILIFISLNFSHLPLIIIKIIIMMIFYEKKMCD